MLSKESPWRRLRLGRDNSDWQAQIYPDTSFKGCRIWVQQPDAKLQSKWSPRNNLEEDQQIYSSYSCYFPKRNFVSQEGDHKWRWILHMCSEKLSTDNNGIVYCWSAQTRVL